MQDQEHEKRLEEIAQGMAQEEEQEKLKLSAIRFNWRDSPRIDHGLTHIHPICAPTTLEFLLPSERLVKLNRLYQYYVYSGILAGLPGDPPKYFLEAIKATELHFPDCGSVPLLLEPMFHCGKRAAGMKPEGEVYAPWLKLPDICTIAEFDSYEPARDRNKHASSLLVIWFQDDYGLPDDAHTLGQLQNLDWETHAFDWSW